MPRRKSNKPGPVRCSPVLNGGIAQCLSDLKEIWDMDSDSAVIAQALHRCRWNQETLMLEANKAVVRIVNDPVSPEQFQALASQIEFLRALRMSAGASGTPTQS